MNGVTIKHEATFLNLNLWKFAEELFISTTMKKCEVKLSANGESVVEVKMTSKLHISTALCSIDKFA